MITSATALLRAALVALASLPNLAFAGLSDQEPPTAIIVTDDFVPLFDEWQPVSGAWSISAGTYNSTARGPTDVTRIVSYRVIDPNTPPVQTIDFEQFTDSARMRIRGTGAGSVGLVYLYQDASNYYELLLATDGTVSLHRTRSGITEQLASIDLHIQREVWYVVEVTWNSGVATVSINGLPAITGVQQREFTSGQVGFVTHDVVGQFDKLLVTTPFGDQPFKHDFSTAAPGWQPQSGQWTVANGTYNDATVQQTNITLAPIRTGVESSSDLTGSFIMRARMLNPYANAGNLVGFVFDYAVTSYDEVVFSSTGVARMNHVENGNVQTVATAAYNGRRNVWFDVLLDNGGSVWVDGKKIFDHVAVNPGAPPEGGVGLITHWAPGRFDDVWFDHGTFGDNCAKTFSTGPAPAAPSGTWTVSGGTLNATSVNSSSIALPCPFSGNSGGAAAGTDFVYKARLFNPYGAAGNQVGLVFNYQEPGGRSLYAGDYYELVFSSARNAVLNKFIQGVRYQVATFPHNVPSNTWFDVQLSRLGIFTTFKVNGVEIAHDVPQGELHGGSIGVVTHWSPGRFDNLSLQPNFDRPTTH